MVIDTSAIIAILRNEPERQQFLSAIHDDFRPIMSASSYLEVSMVLRGILNDDAVERFQAFVVRFGIEVIAFDLAQAMIASEAFRRFGKGRHPARLNLGDCMTYALAKLTGEPLLFKGDDFSSTDIAAVRI